MALAAIGVVVPRVLVETEVALRVLVVEVIIDLRRVETEVVLRAVAPVVARLPVILAPVVVEIMEIDHHRAIRPVPTTAPPVSKRVVPYTLSGVKLK
jgi:hypothetical protein